MTSFKTFVLDVGGSGLKLMTDHEDTNYGNSLALSLNHDLQKFASPLSFHHHFPPSCHGQVEVITPEDMADGGANDCASWAMGDTTAFTAEITAIIMIAEGLAHLGPHPDLPLVRPQVVPDKINLGGDVVQPDPV